MMSREPTEEEVDRRAEWILRQLPVGRDPGSMLAMMPAARSQARAQLREEAVNFTDSARRPAGSARAPRRGRGRPGWTQELFQARWREATEATGQPRTFERVAPNFRRLDGSLDIDPDHLRKLFKEHGSTGGE
jgi:hypothetical protein